MLKLMEKSLKISKLFGQSRSGKEIQLNYTFTDLNQKNFLNYYYCSLFQVF